MKNLIIIFLLFSFGTVPSLKADISPEFKKKWEKEGRKNKRKVAPLGYFDNRKNSISNIEFFTSNYGIFGLDIANGVGGGYWPRNSKNQYIFGGGAWFAAQKDISQQGDSIVRRKYVELSYNPRRGSSWFVPGRIQDKNGNPTYAADFNDIHKYRTYFSTDFDRETGQALVTEEQAWPAWPIWDVIPEDTVKINRYFGLYVEDEDLRNVQEYPDGPAFISEEDIFATFKDSDLNFYDQGFATASAYGYPLYVQIEHMIYSWGFGQYKDFVFLKYDFINFSSDTLWNCWHAPIMDVDVARSPLTAFGARNDRVRWYDCDSTLNMAVQWTDPENGEQGFGFGYLGFDYLESPSVKNYFVLDGQDTLWVDPDVIRIRPNDDPPYLPEDMPYEYILDREGDTLYPSESIFDDRFFLRKTKRVFPVEEQLGLVTFRNWSIENDVQGDNQRYDFMASGEPDGDTGPGDKRYMMATGPYNMAPKDTARVVVAVVLARTSGGGEATGECDDMQELEALDIFAQDVYDNNFRSPLPPDRPRITEWLPLNNGMIIKWDNTSELSLDPEGDGLDFLGYKIYRARRPVLDSFSLEPEPPSSEFISGTGPLGWKQIAEYEIPTPFQKSRNRAGNRTEEEDYYPLMDSLRVIGPIPNRGLDEPFEEFDQMAIRIMRIPKGARLYTPEDAAVLTNSAAFSETVRGKAVPIIATIDTFRMNNDWEKFFLDYAGGLDAFGNSPLSNQGLPGMLFDPGRDNNKLLDSILVGTVFLNRSITPYNPLLYKRKSIQFDASYKARIDSLATSGNNFGDIITVRRTKITKSTSLVLDEDGEPVIYESDQDSIARVYFPPDAEGDDIIDSLVVTFNPGDSLQTLSIREVETTTVDTVFYYNTLKDLESSFVIDISVKRTTEEILEDPEHAQTVLDSIYKWAGENSIERIEFPKIKVGVPRLDENQDTVRNDDGEIVTDPFFYEFEEHPFIREEGGVFDEYFTRVTNNRTFIDLGDDNGDGVITYSDDPTATEKLINNVPYYYRVIPYDEGDWVQDISQRPNVTSFSSNFDAIPNLAQTYPEAPPAGKKSEIKIISIDSSRIGGIHNLRFFAIDQERLQQRFAGDTLELTFTPRWFTGELNEESDENSTYNFDLIQREVTLRNISDNNKVMFNAITSFEPTACDFGIERQLTENAASYILLAPRDTIRFDTVITDQGTTRIDTIDMHKALSLTTDHREGAFTTGNLDKTWCYTNGFSENAFGILGFEYDYSVKQFGGFYRAHRIEPLDQAATVGINMKPITFDPNSAGQDLDIAITNTNVSLDTNALVSIDQSIIDGNQILGLPYFPNLVPSNTSFNNGPGSYILEFSEGGEEIVELSYGGSSPSAREVKEFRVPYLNISVRNVTDFKRFDEISGDSITVPVPEEMTNMILPIQEIPDALNEAQDYNFYPHPANLVREGRDPIEFYGNYNMFAVGWVDVRKRVNILTRRVSYAYPTDPELGFNDNEIGLEMAFSGLQGRYYLSGEATDGSGITVDFTNILNISGALFAFDKANLGTRSPDADNPGEAGWELDTSYTTEDLANITDFQPGDQVRLETYGSAQGLPWPGFSVQAVITEGSNEQTTFTDSELEDVTIAPNPYYITHENQQSPYAPELYFQRLPRKCTIEIYTQNGELIKSIEHDSFEEGGRKAVQVWDLMTQAGMRVQSQTLVALIKADGAEVAKTFSVIVGSYRVIE